MQACQRALHQGTDCLPASPDSQLPAPAGLAPATGFFRDPTDATCRGYYRCEGAAGSWYFTCRLGLAFNEASVG